jgi:hypothetical protein
MNMVFSRQTVWVAQMQVVEKSRGENGGEVVEEKVEGELEGQKENKRSGVLYC